MHLQINSYKSFGISFQGIKSVLQIDHTETPHGAAEKSTNPGEQLSDSYIHLLDYNFIYNVVGCDILISTHFCCTAWGSPSLVEAAPENALRIFKSDGSSKYLLVNVNTQAKEVVVQALKDFNMTSEIYANFALFKVTVANGIVKNSRLPDSLTSLPEQIKLSSR